ncbi:MAG: hypothetical protein GY926_10835 [bacterium]|nr:hypothetical protein [bacterium]
MAKYTLVLHYEPSDDGPDAEDLIDDAVDELLMDISMQGAVLVAYTEITKET